MIGNRTNIKIFNMLIKKFKWILDKKGIYFYETFKYIFIIKKSIFYFRILDVQGYEYE